ncbi:SWIM-type domain-containing protein [Abeliophyllum distichum]|uniref:SWIM-type domain-containing protein n=1 Tax=Abeliophyllum distichum TaxID=126358 RepID=A0ABD1SFB8_9LAMI
MEGGLILLCKYISDTLSIKVSAGGDLNSVLRKLCDNWNSLEVDTILLRYCVPGHDRCFLRNEEEFRNMISLISAFELKFVDISVSDSKTVSLDCKTVSHDCDTIFGNEGSAITTYCSSTNSRALLSSSWSSVITHVGQRFERGVAEFRDALCKFSIERGFKFNYMRNNNGRIEAQCSNRYSDDCRWYICATVSKLHWYIEAARSFNHGSHIDLEVDQVSKRFQRLFVSYHECIHGFNHCRLVLFIDGTFLKGRFKGNLLSATAKNGNQGLYPLAYAVVDSENYDNWLWFLEQLRSIVQSNRELTFVFDRNVGLMEALPKAFPTSNHFFCLQHLKGNLRDKFSGGGFSNSYRERMVWLFRECAHAPTIALFNQKLEVLKREGGAIVQRFLDGLPFENWSNAHSVGCRYGEMSSNAAESFNAWIVDCRSLPITRMVDMLRIKLMNMFVTRRTDSVAAINRFGRRIDEFVDYYFHVAAFRKSYEEVIHPIPTSMRLEYENSANFDILPPPTKRQPGRPKNRRIRSKGEQVRMIRCGRCGKLGNHNKKTYKESLV